MTEGQGGQENLNDWTIKCPFCASDQMRLETIFVSSGLAKTETKHQLLTETDKTLGIYTTSNEKAVNGTWSRFDCQRCENSSWIQLWPQADGTTLLIQSKTQGDTGLPDELPPWPWTRPTESEGKR
jgi:hypothetical protein